MSAAHAFEVWVLPAPTLGGRHQLVCHALPGHVAVVVPRLRLARCHGCGRRLLGRYAWADEPTRTMVVCAACHNREHRWPA